MVMIQCMVLYRKQNLGDGTKRGQKQQVSSPAKAIFAGGRQGDGLEVINNIDYVWCIRTPLWRFKQLEEITAPTSSQRCLQVA